MTCSLLDRLMPSVPVFIWNQYNLTSSYHHCKGTASLSQYPNMSASSDMPSPVCKGTVFIKSPDRSTCASLHLPVYYHVLGMGFKTTLMACRILLSDVSCRYHLHTNTLHCPSDFCMLCRLKCCHDSTPGDHAGVKRGHVGAFEGKPVQANKSESQNIPHTTMSA